MNKGRFTGHVVTEWLDSKHEDRRMKLHFETDLEFIRATGERYPARRGLEFDGASIPVWAWPLIGSPYTGKYRKAAVIHDTLCATRYVSAKTAHLIFYEAMRTLGVGWFRATLMYWALRIGGPKW